MGCLAFAVWAQDAPDSLRTIELKTVEIVAARADARTPIAYTDLDKVQIERQNFGQDIPFLLSGTPSVITTSDAGTGIGYTSIRVRGTDPTRINVTANGIPLNDAESHSIYWVNTPDLASSLSDIQIQRGVGTSTNGAGAFGASVHIRTEGIPATPFAEASGSYGSFNTHKETIKTGTGLLHDRWGVEMRLSNIGSDGYRDRAWADLQSYFVQAGYYGDQSTLKLLVFGGQEKTYHAWDGISQEMLTTNRRYNPNGLIDGSTFYDNQIDLYRQTHYQALYNHRFSSVWQLNVALHYTDGSGYYEEYKRNRTLVEYGLKPFMNGDTETTKSDLVRRKSVDSGFGGALFSLRYGQGRIEATAGGGVNRYSNDHYGQVAWIKNYIGSLLPAQEYYRNVGRKTEANVYGRVQYQVAPDVLSAYLDLQYRHIRYTIDGANDKWDWTATPEHLQTLAIDEPFGFFNPKTGLFWQINAHHSAYASLATAGKEPTRNNYTDGLLSEHPRPEYLYDYEAGYAFRSKRFTFGVNFYYMHYKDQLVLNGKLNEIGEPMAENVPKSFRAGIELTAGWQPLPSLRWDVNATWSRNRILDYTQYGYETERYIGDVPISFSPSLTAGSLLRFNLSRWNASLQSRYVSRQYMDNTGNEDCTLNAYFVHDLHADYTFRHVTVGATVYNLLNEMYETNGYVADGTPYFYPMAGANVLFNLTVSF
ncbi:MAG: TonB-dependent receptor [Prevotellaceae bacterium]|nr:TonB-dependent receptor [Prevotellaceae bacterium]